MTIGEDADGPRRPRAPGGRARAPRRTDALKIGSLLGRVERDRDRHRRRRASRSPSTATARSRCWDYASAGPYLPIDMNPSPDIADGHLAYKDAVFISPHKFVGGPGTPGVLVAKRALFANQVPTVPERRHDPVRQPDPADLPSRARDPRGGRHAGDRRVDPRRARLRAQGGGRRARRSAAARTTSPAARSRRGARTRSIEILGNPDARAAGDRLARRPRTRAGLLHANFVVARAQRPLRHPGAQRLLLRRPVRPPHVPDRRRLVGSGWTPRSRAGHDGRQARVRPAELQLLHERDRLRVHRRRGPPGRRTRAGSCCPSTASTRAAGCGVTPPPPLGCRCH